MLDESRFSKCYVMANTLWKKLGIKRKDISVVFNGSNWFVEYLNLKEEVEAHCKWCAVVEVLSKIK